MRAMLRRADGVVANTPESRTLFLAFEPSLRPDRVAVVTNGWEADDFPQPAPQVIPGANHFFTEKLEPLMETVTSYLDMRLANVR